MTEHGPFTLTELPRGWSVAWPGYETVVATTNPRVRKLLEILFDELSLEQAQLGVSLNNGEFDIYQIDSILWHGDTKARDYLINHIASMFCIGGVKFNDESDARKFLGILEKRYIWAKLGGAWL